MTLTSARMWLIYATLGTLGVSFVFLFLAPMFNYPLEPPENYEILQLFLPVFTGYLGAMVAFVISPPSELRIPSHVKPVISVMVRGPVIVFVAGLVALFVSFSSGAMSLNYLATGVALLLSMLTISTSALVAYLFRGRVDGDGQ